MNQCLDICPLRIFANQANNICEDCFANCYLCYNGSQNGFIGCDDNYT